MIKKFAKRSYNAFIDVLEHVVHTIINIGLCIAYLILFILQVCFVPITKATSATERFVKKYNS